jgi:uncharacterized protein
MNTTTYEDHIRDLLAHQDIQRLKETTNHHWKRDRFAHSYAVGKLSYQMAKFFHANATVAARGGFLHDWFHGHPPEWKPLVRPDRHHFRKSHQAAKEHGEHQRVLHTIRTHFWPWGRMLPKTPEAWIVWSADNLVWFSDVGYSLKTSLQSKKNHSFHNHETAVR